MAGAATAHCSVAYAASDMIAAELYRDAVVLLQQYLRARVDDAGHLLQHRLHAAIGAWVPIWVELSPEPPDALAAPPSTPVWHTPRLANAWQWRRFIAFVCSRPRMLQMQRNAWVGVCMLGPLHS